MHQARMGGAQRGGVQAEPRQRLGPHVRHHHVAADGDAQQGVARARPLQVQAGRALAAVQVQVGTAVPPGGRRAAQTAHQVAARRFHLHHRCAVIGQAQGAGGTDDNGREVQDTDALQQGGGHRISASAAMRPASSSAQTCQASVHGASASGAPAPGWVTPAERDYVRRELDVFFSTLPSVAEGFHLKTWRSGPQAGQPKVPQAAAGLLERGLVHLDATSRWPRLFFTDAGLAALRAMMADARLANPAKFAHIRQELGLNPAPPHAEQP